MTVLKALRKGTDSITALPEPSIFFWWMKVMGRVMPQSLAMASTAALTFSCSCPTTTPMAAGLSALATRIV